MKSYKVKVSENGSSWTNVESGRVFTGNIASGDEKVRRDFRKAVSARYVRIVVQSWNNWIAMRAAVVVGGLRTGRKIKFNPCYTCLHSKVDATCKKFGSACTFPDKHGCVKLPPGRLPDAAVYQHGYPADKNGDAVTGARDNGEPYGSLLVRSRDRRTNDAAAPANLGFGEGNPLRTTCQPRVTGAQITPTRNHKVPIICTTMGLAEKRLDLGSWTVVTQQAGGNYIMDISCAFWKVVVCVDLAVDSKGTLESPQAILRII